MKETDSRSYLNFKSCHPNHIYSGIVFSQCNRLRITINNSDRLKLRLAELKEAFISAGYPNTMIDNISKKVQNSERKVATVEAVEITEISSDNSLAINVVSTYGCDEELIKTLKGYEGELKSTNTFRNREQNI